MGTARAGCGLCIWTQGKPQLEERKNDSERFKVLKKVDNPKKVWIARWQEAGTDEMTIGKPPG